MDPTPTPFVPPAPVPRSSPPSLFEMIRIVYRNPLELWGEPSYNEPWISVSGTGGPLVIANDPGLIRYILVDNARNGVDSPVAGDRRVVGGRGNRPRRTPWNCP